MTKSKMGTHKRPINVPVTPMFDKKRQIQSKNIRTRKWEAIEYTRVGWITTKWRKVTRWFNRFFSIRAIRNLDLTDKTGRADGAKWLRGVFHQNLKMTSTRDGKPV